jgi:flagellar protein FliS
MNNFANTAVSQYQTTDNSSIAYADPHMLILRLMDGAIERIYQAKGAIQQNNAESKGKLIGKAIGIIAGLDACLDRDLSNDLVDNLEAIYEYMNVRLLEANVENDIARLEEVAKLMSDIRSAWLQIPEEVKNSHSDKNVGKI